MAALQRGAKLFANYCLNCHVGLGSCATTGCATSACTDQQIKDNLIFTGAKVGDLMQVAMRPADAKDWFGAAPLAPDADRAFARRLRHRCDSGADYIYTFLRSYYRDETKATGWNNAAAFPERGHAVPPVGTAGSAASRVRNPHRRRPTRASRRTFFKGFETAQPGSMTAAVDEAAADLVGLPLLDGRTAGHQPRTHRRRRVLLFPAIFIIIACA
jgi:ubiquinol-cytochrome c reductase cytochrome c1 subunit